MATDFYELLGVDRNATEDQLRRAYRQLARELHPDANGGDPASEARFKEVTVAYETLRDPERRRRYDMFGADGARQGPTAGDPFGGGLGDLFETFFGGNPFGSPRQNGPRRGDDVETILELRFEEAVFGVERPVVFNGYVSCAPCGGSGAAEGTHPVTCPDCQGAGQVRRVRQSILGQVVSTAPCPKCRGLGQLIESPCPHCRGEGRRVEERSVTVEVPPGVDDGTTLRISGSGAAALRGGTPGDLYVHLRVAAHERFERSGSDLFTTVRLAVTQAALGAELQLETLDGVEHLSIPPGTHTGQEVRLRAKGVPHVRARGRGDLHVRFFVDTPANLTKEQEQLLRELAQQRGEPVAQAEPGLFSPDQVEPRLIGSVEPALREAAALVYVDDLSAPSLSEEDRHHLAHVLRIGPDEVVIACDGHGVTRECRLVPHGPAAAQSGARRRRAAAADLVLQPCGDLVARDAPQPALGIAFGLVKGERSEWTVQKLTELGIDAIWPLLTARTVVRLAGGELARRGERLRRVAREAAAQARRTFLPAVSDPVALGEFVTDAPGVVLAEPGGGELPAGARVVLIGPEGGWAEEELCAGVARVGLGPTVLRAETAALYAAALLVSRRSWPAPAG